MGDMKGTWKVAVEQKDRPTRKMNDYNIANIFSTTLRDTGEVALIDGDTKEISCDRLEFAGRVMAVVSPRWTVKHELPSHGER